MGADRKPKHGDEANAPNPFQTTEINVEPTTESEVPPTMKKKVVKGTVWSVGGQMAVQVMRLAQNIFVARLLAPDDFGLMGLIITVLVGLEMLSDIGVLTSIIQNPRSDRTFLNTAFSIQMVRGVALWALGIGLAWPLSAYYENAQILTLLPVVTSIAFLRGLLPTKYSLLFRDMDVARHTSITVAGQAAALVTTVAIAAVSPSVWALAWGSVANDLVKTILAYLVVRGPLDRFQWEKPAASAILHFGKWTFVSTMMAFIASRFDSLALPKLIDFNQAGVYSQANNLAWVPLFVGGQPLGAVLLPALSEAFRDKPELLKQNFARARGVILPMMMVMILALVFFATSFFDLLYDDRYLAAGWTLQVLMISIWFSYFTEAWSRALLAIGDSRSLAISSAVRVVSTVILTIVGFKIGGFVGFLAGLSLGTFAGYLVVMIRLARQGLPCWLPDAKYIVLTAVVALVGGAGPHWLTPYLKEAGFEGLSFSLAFLKKGAVLDIGPGPLLSAFLGCLVLPPLGLWTFKRLRREMKKQ